MGVAAASTASAFEQGNLGMRIAVTFENPIPASRADAEQFVNNAAALARAGHEVELLIPSVPGRDKPVREQILDYYEVQGPLAVRELPSTAANHTAMQVEQAARAVRDPWVASADFVYTRNFATLTAGLAAGHRVLFEHFRPWGDQYPVMQPYLRALMARPNYLGMILHSDYAARSYRAIGIPDDLLCVCHNGFEPKRMEPVLSREAARAQLGLPGDLPIVVYSGRMNEKKGLDVVLAMARAMPQTRFVLVGSTGRGPVEIEAESLPNVIIAPWQTFSGVAPYLYAADVLLVPPSADPLSAVGNTVLPIKLFVYLAAGRPILAGDTPDVRELLVQDRTAWLVPPGDVAGAVAGLTRLVTDAALRQRLADGARSLSRSLTWDERARRITAFVEGRLRDTRPHALGRFPWGRFARGSERWVREMVAHREVRPAPAEGAPTTRKAHAS